MRSRWWVRRSKSAVIEETGAAAVEFAMVAPLLLLLLFGIVKFGITLNNYLELTDAVRAGSRQLAIGRASATPWTDAKNAVFMAAPNLDQPTIVSGLTMTVNGSTCGTDAACTALLTPTSGGLASKLRATYPCDLKVLLDLAPGCTLTSQVTQRIE